MSVVKWRVNWPTDFWGQTYQWKDFDNQEAARQFENELRKKDQTFKRIYTEALRAELDA